MGRGGSEPALEPAPPRRSLRTPAFPADTGQLLERSAAALLLADLPEREYALCQALLVERLLVGVYPHEAETATLAQGPWLPPSGLTAVAAYTSLESFTAAARPGPARPRPVPWPSSQVALAALAGAEGRLVVDPYSPRPCYLGSPALQALAAGCPWVPAAQDARVMQLLDAALTGLKGVRLGKIYPLAGSGLGVELVVASADRTEVERIVSQAQSQLSALELTWAHYLELRPLPAKNAR